MLLAVTPSDRSIVISTLTGLGMAIPLRQQGMTGRLGAGFLSGQGFRSAWWETQRIPRQGWPDAGRRLIRGAQVTAAQRWSGSPYATYGVPGLPRWRSGPQARVAYKEGVQRRMEGTVWTAGGWASWYLDARGRWST